MPDGFVRPGVIRMAVLRWRVRWDMTDPAGNVTPVTGSVTATAALIENMLAQAGPMTEEELLDALAASGTDLGRDAVDTLAELLDSEDLPFVFPLIDRRQVLLTSFLLNRVFTHRLGASEIEHDYLPINPDLAPLSALVAGEPYQPGDGVPLILMDVIYDAELLEERGVPIDAITDPEVFLLPRGQLSTAGCNVGDLVAVRVSGHGFQVEIVDETAMAGQPPKELGARLTQLLAEREEPNLPEQLDALIWTACADDRELFRQPLPPLGWMLKVVGLPYLDDEVAPAGFNLEAWRVQERIESIQRMHGLEDEQAVAVLALVSMYEQVTEMVDAAQSDLDMADAADSDVDIADAADSGGGQLVPENPAEQELLLATLALVAEPEVAQAVLIETIGIDSEGAAALGVFTEMLEQLAPEHARPAVHWLRGKAHERLGNVGEAEDAFKAAQALDPTWPPALVDLARFASDRGDAVGGLALLERAHVERDHSLVELLRRFRPQPRPGLGRNNACWCGSGRKYKLCHLDREPLPLADRAAWLYQKAGMYMTASPWQLMILEVAEERARHWDFPTALLTACEDPLVTDAVLFEGGAFEDFLADRAMLLPADERLLAEQWLLADRSVYEVEQVRPGRGITVRDLRTGDRLDVRERTASRSLTGCTLICARIVPAGDTAQAFGGIEVVRLHERDALIRLLDTGPDPLELVAFLSRKFAPPELRNTEGEPILMCQATLRIPDPSALSRSLNKTYDRDDSADLPAALALDTAALDTAALDTAAPHNGATAQWTEHVQTHGMLRIRATLRLIGDELRVETNSETRLERVLGVIRSLQPSVTVVDQSRQFADELEDFAEELEDFADPVGDLPPRLGAADNLLDSNDPELATFLDQIVQTYEASWLDESIPALAGFTPRQAADDPTRRPDLIRLLDSFSPQQGAGSMSPARLRDALGLS